MTHPGGFYESPITESVPVERGGTDFGKGAQLPNTLPLSPYQFAPDNSSPLFVSDEALMNGGAGTTASPAGLQFQTAKDQVGVIKTLTLLLDGAGTITTGTVVLWQLMFNNVPVPLLGSAQNAFTVLGRTGVLNVSRAIGVTIPVPANTPVSVQFTNVDGAVYTMGAQLDGWLWPLKL